MPDVSWNQTTEASVTHYSTPIKLLCMHGHSQTLYPWFNELTKSSVTHAITSIKQLNMHGHSQAEFPWLNFATIVAICCATIKLHCRHGHSPADEPWLNIKRSLASTNKCICAIGVTVVTSALFHYCSSVFGWTFPNTPADFATLLVVPAAFRLNEIL